jgi:hypothetical protein
METNDIFSLVVVGGLLIAAAVPLIGILTTSGKNKGVKSPKVNAPMERLYESIEE